MDTALRLIEDHVRLAEDASAALPGSPETALLAAIPREYAISALDSAVAPKYQSLVRWPQGLAE